MRRIRCHVDAPLQPDTLVALDADTRTHLSKVLRLRDGDAVTLFNGDGHDYPAQLAGAGASLSARVQGSEPAAAAESRLSITLVQALARGEKMDWIIQKAVELGAVRIVPVSTQRSEVRLDAERADRRLGHWRKVASSACEQCGRAVIPTIDPPLPLHAALEALATPAGSTGMVRLALDPSGDVRLADLAPTLSAQVDASAAAVVAIGPEGGFDTHELDAFARAGWRRLRLATPILRTETAGMAVIAALRALADEM
jgi:16S rRNA (uracil1498-N3)-methyltransferase